MGWEEPHTFCYLCWFILYYRVTDNQIYPTLTTSHSNLLKYLIKMNQIEVERLDGNS